MAGDQPVPRDGIAPPRIDHVLVNAEEVGESTQFFMDVLGFRITEQLLDGNGPPDGHLAGALALPARPGDHPRAQRRRCTTSRSGSTTGTTSATRPTSWPTTASRSTSARPGTASPAASTIYFFDPLGTRNEVFTGGYRPDPDFPTITWTEDNLGRADLLLRGRSSTTAS